jgi:hypothetical protein
MADHQPPAGSVRKRHQFAGLRQRERQGLLDESMLAGEERRLGQLVMQRRRRSDGDTGDRGIA